MRACLWVIFSVNVLLSDCVTVHLESEAPNIISNYKVELDPIVITSGLNDIVVLSAPIVKTSSVTYLHKPNGEAIELRFENDKASDPFNDVYNDADNSIEDIEVKSPKKFKIFNVNHNARSNETTDVFAEEKSKMGGNDFMIGPLQEDDNGNWVLSTYYEDIDGNVVEMFQVITIEIVEIVPLTPEKSWLKFGEPFILSFAYPIPQLESCQILAPKTTFDRYYDRHLSNPNKCEFVMNNVTAQDQGTWTIIGVGRIVYKGSAFLRVGVIK